MDRQTILLYSALESFLVSTCAAWKSSFCRLGKQQLQYGLVLVHSSCSTLSPDSNYAFYGKTPE